MVADLIEKVRISGREIWLIKVLRKKVFDSVAQLVEHNTFNVGVLGSSPSRITKPLKTGAFFMAFTYILFSQKSIE